MQRIVQPQARLLFQPVLETNEIVVELGIRGSS